MPTIEIQPKSLNLSKDPIFISIKTDKFTGTPPYEWSEDNLSCYMQLWKVGDPDDIFVCEINPSYSRYTAEAVTDLTALSSLSPSVPSHDSISIFSIQSGEANAAYGEYYIKYADRFGSPAEVDSTLSTTPTFAVIYGASKYWAGFGKQSDIQTDYLLHTQLSFRDNILLPRWKKEIKKDSPEYVYYYANAAKNMPLGLTILYTDGTTTGHPLSPVAIVKGVNWIDLSYKSIDIDAKISSGKTLLGYNINFNDASAEMQYVLYDHEDDYDLYLLMSNGIGGCEVIRMNGRKTFGVQTSGQSYRRSRWIDSNFQDGLIDNLLTEGYPTIKCNSGYYAREYIEHLEQLLYGQVWLIDRTRKRFLKYVVTSKSVVSAEDGSDLHAINIDIHQAWHDQSSTTFNV